MGFCHQEESNSHLHPASDAGSTLLVADARGLTVRPDQHAILPDQHATLPDRSRASAPETDHQKRQPRPLQ